MSNLLSACLLVETLYFLVGWFHRAQKWLFHKKPMCFSIQWDAFYSTSQSTSKIIDSGTVQRTLTVVVKQCSPALFPSGICILPTNRSHPICVCSDLKQRSGDWGWGWAGKVLACIQKAVSLVRSRCIKPVSACLCSQHSGGWARR